ncbi:sugar-binding transcriptional regulator [Clostridium sp. Marseille-P3244]|uniref:sugar-binding transcriptional regulator n=1 Tax=Clostridium sp. Marseille-P3244 TaxID=1871020 RepID=UPI000931B219|nr:sugar-binding domain-containing protein [Clostridium sp. Marseille-P3244]
MSVLDNTRLMVEVCKLCYEDGLSQKEISSRLNISRPQISRIMRSAREKGILTINISNPFSEELKLEQQLKNRFGLSGAFVCDVGTGSSAEQLPLFARQCALELGNYIHDGDRVGVVSGKTLSAVASSMQSVRKRDLHFIPLVGALGNVGNDWSANSIARILAFKMDASYSVLNAPILIRNKVSRDILIREPNIASVLKEGESCDLAIVGVGQVSTQSTTYLSGAFNDDDLVTLRKAGAVASVSISYLDRNGSLIGTEITERSIAWQLRKRPGRKILAISTGLSKTEALRAALLSGYIDILMTSVPLARAVLDSGQEA